MKSAIFQNNNINSEKKQSSAGRSLFRTRTRSGYPKDSLQRNQKNGAQTKVTDGRTHPSEGQGNNGTKKRNITWNLNEMVNVYRSRGLLPPILSPTLPELNNSAKQTTLQEDRSKNSHTEEIKLLSIISPTLPAAFEDLPVVPNNVSRLQQPRPTVARVGITDNLVKHIQDNERKIRKVHVNKLDGVDTGKFFIRIKFEDILKYSSSISKKSPKRKDIEGLGIISSKIEGQEYVSKFGDSRRKVQTEEPPKNESTATVSSNSADTTLGLGMNPGQYTDFSEGIKNKSDEILEQSKTLLSTIMKENKQKINIISLLDIIVIQLHAFVLDRKTNGLTNSKAQVKILDEISESIRKYLGILKGEFNETDSSQFSTPTDILEFKNIVCALIGILYQLKAVLLKEYNVCLSVPLKNINFQSQRMQNYHELISYFKIQKKILSNYDDVANNFETAQSYLAQSQSLSLSFPTTWSNKSVSTSHSIAVSEEGFYLPFGNYTCAAEFLRFLFCILSDLQNYFSKWNIIHNKNIHMYSKDLHDISSP